MKRLLLSLLALLGATTLAFAQPAPVSAPSPTIKGTMQISFGTVAQATGSNNDDIPVGAADVYTYAGLNVADSIVFHGVITRLPFVHKVLGGSQAGNLNFNLLYDAVNPRNPDGRSPQYGPSSVSGGQLVGDVPVDKSNTYRFVDGSASLITFARGRVIPMDSPLKGIAVGKPPSTPANILQRARNQAITIARSVRGQVTKVTLTNYDRMDYNNLVLPASPGYPEVTVAGSMLYDYKANAWHFNGMTCSYYDRTVNHPVQDTLSGDIRWVKDAGYDNNGKSQYVFDVCVNEPPVSDASAFAAPPSDSDFFTADDSAMALTGTEDFVDTFKGDARGDDALVTADQVTISLVGNHLSKGQVMYLAKLLLFASVVPMNSN